MRRALAATASLLALAAQPPTEFTPVPGYPKPPSAASVAGELAALRGAPAPDLPYAQDKPCIQPGASGRVDARPWGQMALNFEQVWRFGRGEGQLIAVIDTGVNPHPRFDNRLENGGDYVEGKDGRSDCDGHGTLVAGIIAANADDPKVGFKGVAPEAKILAIRQSSQNFVGDDGGTQVRAGDQQTLAKAIVHATDKGAKVINISSVVCQPASGSPGYPKLQAAVRYARENDSVVVAAAGNVNTGEKSNCRNGNRPDALSTVPSPAWYDDDVLTVGALDQTGAAASFTLGGPWVDIAGPGTDNTSLDPGAGATGLANRLVKAGGQVDPIQGTSFAAPYVSGVVALVRARFPQLNPTQVMERIKKTARQPQGQSGRDFYVGFGMIDPVAALTAVLPAEQGQNPLPPLRGSVEITAAPPADTRPLTVALIGSGAALGLLALVHLAVRALRRRNAG